MRRIRESLAEENAVLVAHYYTQDAIQDLAEETGGIVSDSLARPPCRRGASR